jgi:hypothetical protein
MKKVFCTKIIKMKKIITLAFALTMGITSFQSCTSTMGTTGSSTMGSITNILTSIMSLFGNIPGISGMLGSITPATSLSSILTNPASVTAFQNLLATKFQIPAAKVSSAYSGMRTVQDVANFVSQNGNPTILKTLK